MERISVSDTTKKVGEKVNVKGWVHTRRDHGKIVFIDLRDRSGILQVVFPNAQAAKDLRSEWVVSIEGTINKRPEKMINPNLKTGTVEMQAEKIEILNQAETPPFALDTDGYEIGEENRLKYRYLDIRRERMKDNLILRHRVIKFIRDFLSGRGFIEIETPILTKSTPEGARDYVVPSRIHPGNFYALPQAPQQYKQLLMTGGIEKYFQIAKCFRDEDTRGDRQPEFTQLDLEISFVQREDVMDVNEKLIIELIKNIVPTKKIQEIPFPRISYKEALEKYKTDRPDLRKDKNDRDVLAFCWIIDFPFFEKTEEGGWTFTHNPFSAPKPEYMESLMKKENIADIITSQYDIVLNGFEVGGGSIRNHRPETLKKVFEIMGFKKEKILNNFGHMLEAFSYGTPPHGGIAWGLDRWVAILQNEPNIREVMAFPKTGDGQDPMMGSPSKLEPKQLKELGIKLIK